MNKKIEHGKRPYAKKLVIGLVCATVIFGVAMNSQFSEGTNSYANAATLVNNDNSNLLAFGQEADTGNHLYQPQDGFDGSLWNNIGGTVTSTTPFASTLVNNQLASVGYALFNGALDMSKGVSFSGHFSFQAHSGVNPFAAGDALGFILTPASTSEIETNNANNNAMGQSIGIGGLPNSVFVGRDLYQNVGTDGAQTGPANSPSNAISIRQTDNSGQIITNGYSWASVADSGDASYTVTDEMSIQWTPESVSADGNSVTGMLSYTISSATAQPATISQEITVARSMSLGAVGATGGNYGTLKYDSTGNNLLANKGTQLVQVNYLNSETNQPIGQPSTILANVGDQVSVLPMNNAVPVNATSESYNFIPPYPIGYTYQSSSASVVVANNDSTNNIIDVYYKADPTPVSATFAFAWTNPNETSSLPSSIVENGLQGSSIAEPQLSLPDGYKIDKIVNPNNNTFTNLTDALADSPNYVDNGSLFTIYLSKIEKPVEPSKPSEPTQPSEPTSTPPSSSSSVKAVTPSSSSSIESTQPVSQQPTAPQKEVLVQAPVKTTTTTQVKKEAVSNQTVPTPKSSAPQAVPAATPEKKTNKVAKTVENYVAESAQALRVRLSGAGGVFVGTSASVLGFSLLRKLLQFLKK